MNNKTGKKRGRLIAHVAILFLIGLIAIGALSTFVMYRQSVSDSKKELMSHAKATSKDLEGYIKHYPAHEWLLRYWYEHGHEMEVDYEAERAQDSVTAKKIDQLEYKYEGFTAEFATTTDVERLTPEEQKAYAEVVYSQLVMRTDAMASIYNLDFLSGIITEKPYDRRFFLFVSSKKDMMRGSKTGTLYQLGTEFGCTDSQKEALEKASGEVPQVSSNRDGQYLDYYYHIIDFDGHRVLVGLTKNAKEIRHDIAKRIVKYAVENILLLAALTALLLVICIFAVLRPYEKMTAEREHFKSEMSLANRIQTSVLPDDFGAYEDRGDFDIYASMKPALDVGGDFYDFCLLEDDRLYMVMADVSGKGIPAALYMMGAKISLLSRAKGGQTPAQILTDVNHSLCASNPEEMFVTVWVGILDLKTGKLTAANAGHEYPILQKPGGRFVLYKDEHDFVLGGMDGLQYREYEIQMQPGSRIFLYTDGLPEATDSNKELFGIERAVDALNEAADKVSDTAQETGSGRLQAILEHMVGAVDSFVGDAEQFDDLTMMCVEYKGHENKETES